MRNIPLSHGRFALVDDDDYERLSSSNWFYRPAYDGKPATALRNTTKPDGTATTEYLSRAVMQSPADMRVVFLNGDTLDCRKDNLRLIDRAYAQRRSRVRSDSLSGFKGVRFNRRSGTWSATLCRRRRRIALGTFPSPEEAAAAYQHAAEEWEVVHGDPSVLPLPPSIPKAPLPRPLAQATQQEPSPRNTFREQSRLNLPVGRNRPSRSSRNKSHKNQHLSRSRRDRSHKRHNRKGFSHD